MGTNINQVLKELCQDLGYKKKGYLFYKQLTSEVSSTVGFNISSGQTITHRSVAPQIGVLMVRAYLSDSGVPSISTMFIP